MAVWWLVMLKSSWHFHLGQLCSHDKFLGMYFWSIALPPWANTAAIGKHFTARGLSKLSLRHLNYWSFWLFIVVDIFDKYKDLCYFSSLLVSVHLSCRSSWLLYCWWCICWVMRLMLYEISLCMSCVCECNGNTGSYMSIIIIFFMLKMVIYIKFK